MTSYYSPAFEKYTSFQVHSTEEVRDIHTFEEGILALTPSSFRCQMRRGIPIYTYTSRNLIEMQCFTQITPTNVLMGGHQPHLVNFDFNTSQETQLVENSIGLSLPGIEIEYKTTFSFPDSNGRKRLCHFKTAKQVHLRRRSRGKHQTFGSGDFTD